MSGIKIIGTGSYLPDFVVTNEDFTAFVETSDEWIQTRTGMQRRRISLDEPVWHMGVKAANQALETAGVAARDIDMIIVTSVTPDYAFPSCAAIIQQHIGAVDAFSFDISVACAGVTYSMDMARRYLACGDVKTVLIVAAERLSQVTNYEDRSTCVLLGDGAAAMVVTKGDNLFASYLKTDPSGIPHLYAKKERRKIPFGDPVMQDKHQMFEPDWTELLYMNGKEVYKFATQAMPRAILSVCERAGIALTDVDLIIPHQANLRIIQTAVKNLNISMDQVFVNIQEYANTSSATIPIGLDECIRSGRVKRGDKICTVGFGSGLTYGANLFEY